jgi:MinD-like ATPase involved in chromosome partitioning or flagellar assembly
MALANVAALLARLGQKVLVIDWDLEAPGLERYFSNYLQGSRRSTDGLLDITDAFSRGERMDWRSCLLRATLPQATPIDILHAGREGDTYTERLRAANWEGLFAQKFGNFLDQMRSEWIGQYDYVLIDSRTGITDIGGICTIFMPDYLVPLFTTNAQSVQGIRDTMARARERQSELPLRRRRMVIIPIAARDESATEYRRAAEWRRRAAGALEEFYSDWIHKDETPDSVLDYLKIPYVAYWSFGEPLPVLEEDPQNPKNLAYSYSLVTRLIHTRLDWTEVREGRKTTEQQQQREAEVQVKLAEAAQVRAESQAKAQAEEKEEFDRREAFIMTRYNEHLASVRWQTRSSLVSGLVLGGLSLAVLSLSALELARFGFSTDGAVLGGGAVGGLLGALALIGRYSRTSATYGALRRERAQYEIRGEPPYAGRSSADALVAFAARIDAIAEGRTTETTGAPASGGAPSLSGPSVAPPPTVASAPVSPPPPSGVALPPPTGTAPALPPVSAETAGPLDVFFDYSDTGIVRGWVREFVPLLRTWLSESAGRDIRFLESTQVPPGVEWRQWAQDSMTRAAVVIVVATTRYLASPERVDVLQKMLDQRPQGSFYLLTLDRSSMESAPSWLLSYQWFDFSDLAYIGDGFAKSERYIEFQDRIRKLAATMADHLRQPTSELKLTPRA